MMTHVMVGGSWCSDIYFFKIFPVAHRHQKIQIKATEHAVWTHGFTRAIVQRFQMGCVCVLNYGTCYLQQLRQKIKGVY